MLLLVEEGCTRESSLETAEGSGGGRGQGLAVGAKDGAPEHRVRQSANEARTRWTR